MEQVSRSCGALCDFQASTLQERNMALQLRFKIVN